MGRRKKVVEETKHTIKADETKYTLIYFSNEYSKVDDIEIVDEKIKYRVGNSFGFINANRVKEIIYPKNKI